MIHSIERFQRDYQHLLDVVHCIPMETNEAKAIVEMNRIQLVFIHSSPSLADETVNAHCDADARVSSTWATS